MLVDWRQVVVDGEAIVQRHAQTHGITARAEGDVAIVIAGDAQCRYGDARRGAGGVDGVCAG